MGILKSLFQGGYDIPEANVPEGWDQAREWLTWEAPFNLVRGEDRYQEAIQSLAGPIRKHGYLIPVAVTVSREQKNLADKNALLVEIDGLKVGYLAKEFAAQTSPLLDKARLRSFVLAGLIRGGASRAKTFGVHVWTARRLSPGPGIEGLELPEFEIRWPPYGVEGSGRDD